MANSLEQRWGHLKMMSAWIELFFHVSLKSKVQDNISSTALTSAHTKTYRGYAPVRDRYPVTDRQL